MKNRLNTKKRTVISLVHLSVICSFAVATSTSAMSHVAAENAKIEQMLNAELQGSHIKFQKEKRTTKMQMKQSVLAHQPELTNNINIILKKDAKNSAYDLADQLLASLDLPSNIVLVTQIVSGNNLIIRLSHTSGKKIKSNLLNQVKKVFRSHHDVQLVSVGRKQPEQEIY